MCKEIGKYNTFKRKNVTVPLSPTAQLLYKATLPRMEDIADLHNAQQQTQRESQNWEAKKHTPNERIGKNPLKKELMKKRQATYQSSKQIKMLSKLKIRMNKCTKTSNKEMVSQKINKK